MAKAKLGSEQNLLRRPTFDRNGINFFSPAQQKAAATKSAGGKYLLPMPSRTPESQRVSTEASEAMKSFRQHQEQLRDATRKAKEEMKRHPKYATKFIISQNRERNSAAELGPNAKSAFL